MPVMLFFIWLFVVVFFIMYIIRRNNINHLKHIPGPPTNDFFLGNSSELKNPVTRVETITRWYREYGPVFKLTGGVLMHSEVVLVDPDVENAVMRIPDKGNGFWPFKWFVKFIGRTEASFVMDGPEWEKRRKEVMHQGFMFSDLPSNFNVLNANLQKVMHLVESKQSSTDIHQLAALVFIDSMSESLFGASIGVIAHPDHRLVSSFEKCVKEMAIIQNYPPHFFKWSTLKTLVQIKRTVFSTSVHVDERLSNPDKYKESTDVCSRVVHSGVLNRNSIVAEMTSVLLAASGNPSLSITWLFYTLINHPHIMERLEAELLEVLRDRTSPTYDELKGMKYLDHVVQETFRVFIPDAIHRKADKDLELHDLHIPKGSQIWIPSFLSHFEKVGPNPLEFNPDRFDSDTPVRIHPFGGGPRICLGHMWTKLAVKIVVANIVHNYHISLDKETAPVIPEFHMLLFESSKIKFNFVRKDQMMANSDGADQLPAP